MATQADFENMVAGRGQPVAPEMNPNSSDLTRGLQVASFAADIAGQVVRSQRESQGQEFASKANQLYQQTFKQTGSHARATRAVNNYSSSLPTWGRQYAAQGLAQTLEFESAALRLDQSARQEKLSQVEQREATAIQDDPRWEETYEWLSDEENRGRLQGQMAYQTYVARAQEEGLPEEQIISPEQFEEESLALAANPEAPVDPLVSGAISVVAGQDINELTEFALTSGDLMYRAARSTGESSARERRVISARREMERANTTDSLLQATRNHQTAVHDLMDFTRTDMSSRAWLFGEIYSNTPPEERADLANRAADTIEKRIADIESLIGVGTDSFEGDDLRAYGTTLESYREMARQIRALPESNVEDLEREVRRIQAEAQLDNESLTRVKAVLGSQGYAAVLGISQDTATAQWIHQRLNEVYGTGGGGNTADILAQSSAAILDGSATDRDYEVVAVSAYSALEHYAVNGFTTEEIEEAREYLLPVIMAGNTVSSTTEEGRQNILNAWNTLSPLSDELGDEPMFQKLRAEAAIISALNDDDLADHLTSSTLLPEQQVVGTPSGNSVTVDNTRTIENARERVSAKINGIRDSFEGTVYADASDNAILGILKTEQNIPLTEDEAREYHQFLVDNYTEEQEAEEDQTVDLMDKSIRDRVAEQIAFSDSFLGVNRNEFIDQVEYVDNNGNPKVLQRLNQSKVDAYIQQYVATGQQEQDPEEEEQQEATE